MKNSNRPIILILIFLTLSIVLGVRAQDAKLLTVNDNGDTHDANAGDGFCADAAGRCTLRAALEESGAAPLMDGVNFALGSFSTIDLTLGELPVTSAVYIAGPGAQRLTVRRSPAPGTPNFRVFNFASNAGPLLTLRGMRIENGNLPDGDGGAIYNSAGNTLALLELVVANNSAARGGGIFTAGTVKASRTLIRGNTALANGGGVYADPSGSVSFENSTLTENSAAAGGAVYNAGSLLLVNATISHNTAANSGASLVGAGGATSALLNTLVGPDDAPVSGSLAGAFTSYGSNLIADARNTTGLTNGVNNDQVSLNNAIDPRLGPLSPNGGPTETRALLDGSPAIDHGNRCVYDGSCPSPIPLLPRLIVDQRGNSLRLAGTTVDVGAYEYAASGFIAEIGFGGFENTNRSSGQLLLLTDAADNVRTGRIANSLGGFRFDRLYYGGVYFLERRAKRANQRRGLLVLTTDGLPLFGREMPVGSIPEDGWRVILKDVKLKPAP
ncbi:MAG: right-handed parallel beta-helix repeat-containing protein [Acidobacteria bacterium]|nr:right-handed parallel beta-helix repeat-containing protein [Acidobacteriota bacterium]